MISEELNRAVAAMPCSGGEQQVQQEPAMHSWSSNPWSELGKGMPVGQGI